MNTALYIAGKVAASGQKSFSRLIIRIAVAAVALSLVVMIVSTALISGFKKEISSKIFGFWGDIRISSAEVNQSLLEMNPVKMGQDFYPSLDTVGRVRYLMPKQWMGREWEKRKTTKGGIRHIQVFAFKPGIVKTDEAIEGLILKGVGKDFEWDFLKSYLKQGEILELPDSTFSRDILVSQQTANRLKLNVGDAVDIYFVEKAEPLRRRFTVKGIYQTGLDEYDRMFALVDIRQIQRILGWQEDEVGGFEVFIEDIDDLVPMTEYIYYEKIPNSLYAETLREKLPEIFEWLEMQNINEKVILGLMIIVAVLNMITALLILILERTNMVGLLKSIGAGNWLIRKIFLYYAAYIIVWGLIIGNMVGIGLCLIQKYFKIIKLSEADYYLSVAPVDLRLWPILMLNVGTFIVILVFLILPSYLITTITPVKAIRFK